MRVNTSVVDDAFSDGIFQQLLSQFSHVELREYDAGFCFRILFSLCGS